MIVSFIVSTVSADTVVMKNGERLKGLILDDYKDRVILSTVDGEKILMKSDLKTAIYESEVDALFKQAVNYENQNNHLKAYYAYEKVLEIEPGRDLVRNRMIYLENYLGKQLKNDFYKKLYRNKSESNNADPEGVSRKLFYEVGLSLKADEPYAKIDLLDRNKVSICNIDFTENDRIVSVWGKKTAYMDVNEVAYMLLEPGEVKLTIEREYFVKIPGNLSLTINPFISKLSRLIGAKILLKKNGFVVAKIKKNGPFYETGIKNGDRICYIEGKNVRFMPYADIQKLIVDSRGDNTAFVVRRNVSFWKKESY